MRDFDLDHFQHSMDRLGWDERTVLVAFCIFVLASEIGILCTVIEIDAC